MYCGVRGSHGWKGVACCGPGCGPQACVTVSLGTLPHLCGIRRIPAGPMRSRYPDERRRETVCTLGKYGLRLRRAYD